MKGDFSRDTFDSVKHFSRVLQQQGRVQLDADWNEQAAILLHYLRTLAADLLGPFAGPDGSKGFAINRGDDRSFNIGAGRYYVDGILCENEQEVAYKNQTDLPNPPSLVAGSSYLVYLDVWERHITTLEDDYIREKALGGPDTATRMKVVWQVKVEDATTTPPAELSPDTIRKNWEKWIALWQPPHIGCLKARVKRPEDSNDPCLTAPDAKYRGAENQLYRIEIHRPGRSVNDEELTAWRKGSTLPPDVATFRWSRDNGAIVTSCELNGAELTVHNPRGFAANQWVELTNDGQELRGIPGALVKLIKVEGDQLILEQTVAKPADVGSKEVWPTKVRRWDQSGKGGVTLEEGAAPLKEGATEADWIELEDGIQIQFVPAHNDENRENRYRTGDYWLIPARVATGNIEWPVELDTDNKEIPIPKPPHGIRHHYAPLAILNADGPVDCRCQISPLNDCNLPSFGEEGMGGHPLCDATDTAIPE